MIFPLLSHKVIMKVRSIPFLSGSECQRRQTEREQNEAIDFRFPGIPLLYGKVYNPFVSQTANCLQCYLTLTGYQRYLYTNLGISDFFPQLQINMHSNCRKMIVVNPPLKFQFVGHNAPSSLFLLVISLVGGPDPCCSVRPSPLVLLSREREGLHSTKNV